jgi:hypothetical protein
MLTSCFVTASPPRPADHGDLRTTARMKAWEEDAQPVAMGVGHFQHMNENFSLLLVFPLPYSDDE